MTQLPKRLGWKTLRDTLAVAETWLESGLSFRFYGISFEPWNVENSWTFNVNIDTSSNINIDIISRDLCLALYSLISFGDCLGRAEKKLCPELLARVSSGPRCQICT